MNQRIPPRTGLLWIGGVGVVIAVACGTTSQPPAEPVQLPAANAPADASATEPACPEDKVYDPDAGCVYTAEGTPPSGAGPQMLPIPAGDVAAPREADAAGKPTPVDSFWLDPRPVRVAEYRKCVEAGQCQAPIDGEDCPWSKEGDADKPIVCVTWENAEKYCAWGNKRLITDAEWDRAVSNHAAYGLTFDEVAEWTSDLYCKEPHGCTHARVLRNYDKPEGRSRMLARMGGAWVGFRCAWSERPPPRGERPPALVDVVPTTPGAISCATETCNLATEVCCDNQFDGVGVCIPKQQQDCPGAWTRAQCDENADCPTHKVCCPYWGCSGGCPPEFICQDAPCDYGPEACLPGGHCRQGFRCVTESDGRHAHCEWEDVGARCGGKRCSGAEPVCCWDGKKRQGTCSAGPCGRSEDVGRFACSGPKDCGGSVCGRNPFHGDPEQAEDPGYGCVVMSYLLDAVLCDRKSDCPVHPPTGSKPIACRHTPELPPGVKACIYFQEP